MPAGYTASALISTWPTNASGQFIIGIQRDRQIQRSAVTVLSGGTVYNAFTSFSLSTAVPPNAVTVSGYFYTYFTAPPGFAATLIASDVNGTGVVGVCGYSGGSSTPTEAPFSGALLITQQTLCYSNGNTSGSTTVLISGYTF